MESVKIKKKDLDELLKGFVPYRSKSRLSYAILNEILNWEGFNKNGALSYEIPINLITPKIWPKDLPDSPQKNYNQAFDNYLNPVSELLYLVGKVNCMLKFHSEADSIVITAFLRASPLKKDIETFPAAKKEILLDLLYKELPITKDYFKDFINNFDGAVKRRSTAFKIELKKIGKSKIGVINLDSPFEAIETIFKELLAQDNEDALASIISELEDKIKQTLIRSNLDLDRYEEAPYDFQIIMSRKRHRESRLFRREMSLFILLCCITLSENKSCLYGIICKSYKNIFLMINNISHTLYMFQQFSISTFFICSYALKLKRKEFIKTIFSTEAECKHAEYDFEKEIWHYYKIKDSLPGLIHLKTIDWIDYSGYADKYRHLIVMPEKHLYKIFLLSKYHEYSPYYKHLRNIYFYEILIMLRFYRDSNFKSINFNIPFYAWTSEEIKSFFKVDYMEEIRNEIIEDFAMYNKVLQLPSEKAFNNLLSFDWDMLKIRSTDKPIYYKKYEKSTFIR